MDNVIVVIPHYNNLKGLRESMRSIEETAFVDILVVDDGSVEKPTLECLQEWYKGNVYLINNTFNRGIEHVLNDGLSFALHNQYMYTARLDCGDVCMHGRFEKQRRFLDENQHVALLGSHARCVDMEGTYLYDLKMPLTDAEIRNNMFLNAMFIHPTILFRTDILNEVGLYPVDYKYAEDYAFFFEVLKKYKGANIDEVLVQIEINEGGISLTRRKEQVLNRIRLIKKYYYFGFYPVYGLIRSYILLYLPVRWIRYIKSKLY